MAEWRADTASIEGYSVEPVKGERNRTIWSRLERD